MTNEEARNLLKGLKDYYNDKNIDSYIGLDNEDNEALDMAIKALEQQPCEDKGEISDGYHTFNQLYYQRAILFATIVNQNKDKAWKSFKHSDGNYCFDSNGEWFIVGIDTPQGSYTYHYAKEYWDYFDCEEFECGKIWDGHTEEDVTRLLSLEQEPCEDCISRAEVLSRIDAERKHLLDIKMDGAEHIIVHHARRIIEDMPSVTPKARWIPCSKRLPKENEYIGDVCKHYLIQDEYGDMHVAHLSNAGWRPMDSLKAIGNEVVAWQPLPQPYKAESEE